MTVRWEERFSVGIDILDDQHKNLIALTNKLRQVLLAGEGRKKVFPFLKELADYSLVHFITEETFMKDSNYPFIDEHIKQHNIFKNDIAHFIIRQQSGEPLVANEILRYLENWIVEHITTTDKKYKGHIG